MKVPSFRRLLRQRYNTNHGFPSGPARLNRREILRSAAIISGGALVGGGLLTSGCTSSAEQGRALSHRFPTDFLWGAGTSGLQHEGSPLADGAGPSSMYQWAHASKAAENVTPDWFTPPIDTFDVSADFYHRYGSDIQLMRDLNLQAYNFEVYWPRILPEGIGKVNEAGLDFYDRLVDEFLAANIVPLCNLYVFDHPSALQDRGGWLNRDMAKWFADYATILYNRLGDRVPYWTTICEPFLAIAYTSGLVAPSPASGQESAYFRAVHHILLAQGMAVQALRASNAEGQIGNQSGPIPIKPASDHEVDISLANLIDARTNLLYLDPQFRGEYPQLLIDHLGETWPSDAIKDGDLSIISAPIDFFGIDYYESQVVRHDPSAEGEVSVEFSTTGQGMYDALTWIRDRYGNIPIFILEIGEAVEDTVVNSQVDDSGRLQYLHELLMGTHKAIQDGVDVRACFIWSFLDGWEFGFGLSRRYGLVHVDFESQERTIKKSGLWYRDLITANGF